LSDEIPWWVKSPRLRPLSEWIRQLYRDEFRLPTMIISEWVGTVPGARLAERTRICDCLEQRLSLLNIEAQILGRQILLL
jgi:hypothetical protein